MKFRLRYWGSDSLTVPPYSTKIVGLASVPCLHNSSISSFGCNCRCSSGRNKTQNRQAFRHLENLLLEIILTSLFRKTKQLSKYLYTPTLTSLKTVLSQVSKISDANTFFFLIFFSFFFFMLTSFTFAGSLEILSSYHL